MGVDQNAGEERDDEARYVFSEEAKKSSSIGASKVLILGTTLTIRSARFRDEFAKYGIEAIAPDDEATRVMTSKLIAELGLGKADRAAERLMKIVRMSFEHSNDISRHHSS